MTVKEKLGQELKKHVAMTIERIAKFLEDECVNDKELEAAVLSDKKTLDDCEVYITKKAKEVARGKNAVMIDDPTVYGWIKEYYKTPAEEKEPEKESTKKDESEEKEPKKESTKKSAKKEEKKPTKEEPENKLAEEPIEEDDLDDDFDL